MPQYSLLTCFFFLMQNAFLKERIVYKSFCWPRRGWSTVDLFRSQVLSLRCSCCLLLPLFSVIVVCKIYSSMKAHSTCLLHTKQERQKFNPFLQISSSQNAVCEVYKCSLNFKHATLDAFFLSCQLHPV